MIGSKLATKIIQSAVGNYAKGRNGTKISEITIHHMAGNLSVEGNGVMWQKPGAQVSSHYGVNGINVGQYVDELDTAYCNGNLDANRRSVTIETANAPSITGKNYEETLAKGTEQGWPVTDETIGMLIKLVADIAKRNNLGPLVVGKTLKYHSMIRPTVCPGPYLISRMQYIADEANKLNADAKLGKAWYKVIPTVTADGKPAYAVVSQVIALTDEKKAQEYASNLNKQET